MAWDITDTLTYKNVKTGFEQGGYSDVLPQIIGTTSGAYVKEPTDEFGVLEAKVNNELTGTALTQSGTNPEYSAAGQNFYTTLTQGGSAYITISEKDTQAKTPEIQGKATAYQNMWVGGEFNKVVSTFDSNALVGFTNVEPSTYDGPETTHHFVVTDTKTATATVDSLLHGAGYFNSANTGVQVDADIQQNYVGSGWAEPTYSGGITMWANFAGACDPHCENPIMTSVAGTAGTSIFPANTAELVTNSGYGAGNLGNYWDKSTWDLNSNA
jgi:hypothetical protein